ncbi:hypothetical protein PG993_009719 [Apiospora rasikravindrae]|uniref:Uncharacterized protein n=1 Tax=Apiospora rasikravindrae TaxID=990691 RepID=A0ABR1SK77_9PEZI
MNRRTATETAAPQVVLPKDKSKNRVHYKEEKDALDDKPKDWYVDVTDSEAETHQAMLVQWIFVFVVLVGSMYWYLGDDMMKMLRELISG